MASLVLHGGPPPLVALLMDDITVASEPTEPSAASTISPANTNSMGGLSRTSALVSFLSLAASLSSFVNQLVIAHFFGAGARLDDYLIAISVPTMAMGITAGLFSYSIVPQLVHRRTTNMPESCKFAGALLKILLACAFIVPAVAYTASPALVRLLAPKLNNDRLSDVIRVSRIAWGAFGCVILFSFLVAVHNSAKKFLVPVLANIAPYLGMIGSVVFFSSRLGTSALAFGLLGGYAAALPVLYWGVAGELSLRGTTTALWRQAAATFGRMPWVMISMLCFTVYGTIDAYWASRLAPGNVSYLGYGQRILIAVCNIIVLGPSTVLAPYLAEASARGEHGRFLDVTRRAVRMVLALSAPVAVLIAILGMPLVSIVFQRGAFGAAATQGVSAVLPGLLCGMVAMTGVVLSMKALHARGDIKGAAWIGGGGAALYFALSGILSHAYGVVGISVAYALSWWIMLTACMRRIFSKNILAEEVLGKRKVNVLIVGADDVPSGVATYVSQLILHCNSEKYCFHATTSQADASSPSYIRGNVRKHYLPKTYSALNFWKRILELRAIIKAENIDLLHLHTARAGFLGAVASLGCHTKIIYTGHTWRFTQKKSYFGRTIFYLFERAVCQASTFSTFLTESEREFGIKYRLVGADSGVAIATRTEMPGISTTCPSGARLKRALGIPENSRIIGNVGSLYAIKNPYKFIEIAAQVHAQFPQTHFLWVGDGELRESCIQRACESGIQDNLIITGALPHAHVPNYIDIIDVMLFTSIHEGVPFALIEAQLLGKPIVAARYFGIEDLIDHEVSGYIFEPSNVSHAVDLIGSMLKDTSARESIAVNARSLAERNRAHPEIMAQEFEAVYDSALGKKEFTNTLQTA